ncbi:MAG: hypothetical protein ACI9MX_000822 [Candidatus Aldehydirespiratoraceae bacterium]|jgi:hypothetical protein
MSTHRNRLPIAAAAGVLSLGLFAISCGGASDPVTPAGETDAPSAAAETESDEVVDLVDGEAEESTPPSTSRAPDPAPLVAEILAVEAEPGPRPLLSWAPVAEAQRYTLVVLGLNGDPYWAWSGVDTSVAMGGITDPDVVGPWVHEPMTWTVAAIDATGLAIALSDPGALTP